jgi:hypothetical protein
MERHTHLMSPDDKEPMSLDAIQAAVDQIDAELRLPPEIEAIIEEGRAHPELRRPWRRRTDPPSC